MVIVLTIALLVAAVFVIGLLVTLKKYRDDILSECKTLSDHIGALAYGNLTLTFPSPVPKKRLPALKSIYNEIDEIKRSYNNLTATPLDRICYVGTDPYLEGFQCAEAMAGYCGGKARVAVIITVSLDISNLDLRYRGFKHALAEQFGDMHLLDVFEARGDAVRAHEYVKACLREHPDLRGIYISGGSMAAPVAQAIEDLKLSGKVIVICHDIGQEMIEYVRKGVITATLLQDPIIQGHDPIVLMYNHLVAGWKPIQPRLLCVMDLVTKDNCEEHWDFRDGKIKKTKAVIERMAAPAAAAGDKKVKIAVFGQDWNNFFLQIKSGALEAIEKLRGRRAEIEWIPFNQARRSPEEITAEAGSLVDRVIAEKFDGLVSIVGLKSIVPHLNRAIAAGIPIITFNSEPLGLLGMLAWLERTSKNLHQMSDELNEGSAQMRQAMEQISRTSYDMVNSIINQSEGTKKGLSSTERLKEMLEHTAQGEKSQMAVVDQSSELTRQISDLITRFRSQLGGMEELKKGIALSTEKIRDMDRYSGQIGSIVTKIDYIASQTNILAINAAIQSTKAAQSGKGFKVIADEVRELASDSGKAVFEIAELVRNIQESVRASVSATAQSAAEAEKQTAVIGEGAAELENLSRALVEIMERIQRTSQGNATAIQEMRNDSQALTGIMNDTSSISMENNSAIEELSASTVEISAQMNEISKMVSLLKNIVQVLRGSLAQFKTDKKSETSKGPTTGR
jgi:methyl-accepting chemotaxis protein